MSRRTGPGTAGSLWRLVAFMAVTLLAFGTLAATITGVRFAATSEYEAVFSDVTGLVEGDDVRIAGVRVGEVVGIAVAGEGEEERGLARVSFTVDDSTVLTEGTGAAVRWRNIIGQRYLALTQGAGATTPLTAGATIPLERTQPPLDLTVLFNGFKPLFAALSPQDVNAFAFEVIQVLQGEGGTIESLLARTASLTSTLADRDEVIGRTIENLNVVLETVGERSAQLDQLLVQLQRFVSGLAQDREAIGASLASIADVSAETAQLLEEGRPALQQDVAQLGDLAALLNANEATVEDFLQTWPGKLETITRTATYGAWFNFYLCDFDGQITPTLPTGQRGPSLPLEAYDNPAARCSG